MKRAYGRSKRHPLQYLALILIFILGSLALPRPAFARTTVSNLERPSPAECRQAAEVSDKSLLVVLLDRSGSLIEGSAPTDPRGYSTSVTKALSDLWPGDMAVIPFSGTKLPLPILGPDTLSNPTQRADLKQKIQDFPIGDMTPLAPAMQQGIDLLHQHGSPAGSRVIVITDGSPTGNGDNDGPHQEDAIRHKLVPQYCQQGIPISVFGLTIDPKGQADTLLSDIATETGAPYTNVTSPEQLASEVIGLYATWQHLTFEAITKQRSTFPVSIDPFAEQVNFVSFRSESNYPITLIGPDNQPVTTGVQKSTPEDRHYEIDSMLITGPLAPGTYTITIAGDPKAQVYALIRSPIQVQLTRPTEKEPLYANKPVHIEAVLVNGADRISDNAQIIAKVTLLVNGRPAGPPTEDIVLTRQNKGSTFSGQTGVYNQPGQLQIELKGTYRNVQRQSNATRQLLPVPIPLQPPCDFFTCFVPKIWVLVLIIIGAVILLALSLLVARAILIRNRERPKPYGYITNGKPPSGDVELERFKNPVVSSRELEIQGAFRFGEASFELVFDSDGSTSIRVARDNAAKVAVDTLQGIKPVEEGKPLGITTGRKIYVNGVKVASFEASPGRKWS